MILSNSLFRKNDHSIKAEALGRIVLCVSLHVKVFPSWPQRVTVCWRHRRVFVKDIPGIHAEIPSCMNVCTICSLNCRKGVFLSYLSVCVWLNMTEWPVFHQIVYFCRSVSARCASVWRNWTFLVISCSERVFVLSNCHPETKQAQISPTFPKTNI